MHWPKNLLLIKNPQFWSDWADIQAVLPIHGLVILTKFHDSRATIADLISIVSLWTSAIFYYSVSRSRTTQKQKIFQQSLVLQSHLKVLAHTKRGAADVHDVL